MALQYSPKIVQDSLVMCLDASNNKSYPTDLPVKNGLALWLDAADDTTFSYSSGTSVSQWRDKSGLNNHVGQSTVGSQPNRNVVKNSRKSIYFDGGDSLFNAGDVFPSNTTDYTKIAVVYQTSTSTTGNIISSKTNTSGTNNAHAFYFGNSTFIQLWHNSTFVTSPNALAINTLGVISGTYINSSGLGSLYVNGTASGTGTTASRNIVRDIQIGAIIDSSFFTGEICEVLVFSRVLSLTELKQVHTYLGQKWGISNTDRSIVDLSNNNNHGLLGGVAGSQVVADMPLFDVYNKGALKLDGSTDYISVENATSLNPTTVTVSIWIKRNGYQSSIASYLRRNYNDAYGITGDIAADNVRFRIHNGTTYPESPNATLSLNEWTNIVGTYDLANIKIYKNGVFVGQTAHTSAISYASANTTLTIGRDDPVAGRYMNANYGSVLIYSRALSATEISQNYEAQKSKFANTIVQQGLVLNLDAGNIYSYAGAGTTWIDVSGNSFNGTLTNSPTYSSDNNGLISFNGSSQYVDCGNVLASLTDLSLECFVKFGTQSALYGGVISKTLSNANGYEIRVDAYTSTTTSLVFRYVGDNAGVGFNTNFTNGVWYHVVATGTNGSQKTYVNGNQVGSATYALTPSANSNSLLIAKLTYSGFYVNMTMGYTRIYNRVLSAAEVLQNYNATKGRFGL
jgi:hypothetical protein